MPAEHQEYIARRQEDARFSNQAHQTDDWFHAATGNHFAKHRSLHRPTADVDFNRQLGGLDAHRKFHRKIVTLLKEKQIAQHDHPQPRRPSVAPRRRRGQQASLKAVIDYAAFPHGARHNGLNLLHITVAVADASRQRTEDQPPEQATPADTPLVGIPQRTDMTEGHK
jgi:hypothetical protein